MEQRRILPDHREKTWHVDTMVLQRKLPHLAWLSNTRLLKRDLTQMAEYLPHWLLTVGREAEPLRSSCCQDNIAPIEGELRCILCHKAIKAKANSLLWVGLLPVNLEGRDRVLNKIIQAQKKGTLHYPIITPAHKRHLLVPIVVEYPRDWPYSPPQAHYADDQYLKTLALEGHWHLLGERKICLYAHYGTEWNDQNSIMDVIANRVAPHAFALLRLANGETNIEFFQ